MKKVEILLAVYNGEAYIREQIQSILNQTHQNIRLIIRDNCSIDGTKEMMREFQARYPEKIHCLFSETNVGVIGNFSALIDEASAPYVMLADHDDVWLPEKVEKTLRLMEETEKKEGKKTPILVHSDLKVVDRDLKVIHPSFWKYCCLDPFKGQTLSRLLVQNQVTGCTLMMNQALYTLLRPVPLDIVMHDWWIALTAITFGKIAILPEATILYRQHGGNDTGAKQYSALSLLKRAFDRKSSEKQLKCQEMTNVQAKEFLKRFNRQLEDQTKNLIEAFIAFDQAIFFKKAYLMIKYKFYRVGWLRNCALLFGSRNLRILLKKLLPRA